MSKLVPTFFIAALLLTIGASGQNNKVHVTGFFTNMKYIAEAGDVVGMEVWIVYARDGYWATVQVAEGAPDPPVVVPVQVSGKKVSFSLPDVGRTTGLKFDGEVGSVAVTGTFVGERMVLKRYKSYWQ